MTQWSSRWKRFCLQCAYWVRQDRGCSGRRGSRGPGWQKSERGEKHTYTLWNPLLTELSVSTEAKRHPGWGGCVTHHLPRSALTVQGLPRRWNWTGTSGTRPPGWTVDQEKTNMGSQFPDWGSNLHSCIGRQSLNYWTARESLYLLFLMQLVCVWGLHKPRAMTYLDIWLKEGMQEPGCLDSNPGSSTSHDFKLQNSLLVSLVCKMKMIKEIFQQVFYEF